jgi:hypothetical protein
MKWGRRIGFFLSHLTFFLSLERRFKMMYWLKKLPLILIVMCIWAFLRVCGLSFPAVSAQTVILGVAFGIVIAGEFMKSADIMERAYDRRLFSMMLSIIICVFMLTKVTFQTGGEGLCFGDLIPIGGFLAEAICLRNAFKTALRNWSGGGATIAAPAVTPV